MSIQVHEKTDEELLAMIKNRSKLAFTELIYRHSSKFYSLAYRILANKDLSEELVQEAFTKLWIKPESWNEKRKTKFTTWFYRVVINLCLDKKKKDRWMDSTDLNDTQIEHFDSIEYDLDSEILQKKISTWILDLPLRQQIALNLVFYQGLSLKEAANIMDTAPKTIESLLSRAKQNLKDRVKGLNYER